MKILVTGHDGYIGTVMCPILADAGHEVVGLDSHLYEGCVLGEDVTVEKEIRKDVRDVVPEDFEGFDAVIHLAAISNDPLGDYRPELTDDINHVGTMTVARAAKKAGVERFLFSSSCSLYGAQSDATIDESGEFLPVTPYGQSKVDCERGLSAMADDDFSPTFLRNATAYGASPRLRGDLVVNNLTGYAVTTGVVLMKSDGSPWRPLVHIEDISRAFLRCVEAPRDLIHDEAFNVGATSENYQIRDVARIVEEAVPRSTVTLARSAGPDLRNYRVNCDKISEVLNFQCSWTVADGVEQLRLEFQKHELRLEDLEGTRFMRIGRVKELISGCRVDDTLRWR